MPIPPNFIVEASSRKERRKLEREQKRKGKNKRCRQQMIGSTLHNNDDTNDRGAETTRKSVVVGADPAINKKMRKEPRHQERELSGGLSATRSCLDSKLNGVNKKRPDRQEEGKKVKGSTSSKRDRSVSNLDDYADEVDRKVNRIGRGDNGMDGCKDSLGMNNGVSHKSKTRKDKRHQTQYDQFDSGTAALLRQEDEEIAALESKLGLADKKEKARLHREYAKLECYGDDFGDFLDDLDTMVQRISSNGNVPNGMLTRDNHTETHDIGSYTESDEEVPMNDLHDDDDDDDENEDDEDDSKSEVEDDKEATREPQKRHSYVSSDSETEYQTSESSEHDNDSGDADNNTYRPSVGEDIYGRKIDETGPGIAPAKYVPPHLRKETDNSLANPEDEKRLDDLRSIRKSLNNALNKVSESTLVSVAQSISALYASHPTNDINNCIWENARDACIARAYPMVGLIPIYISALSGVHAIKGDLAQLGEYLMEKCVLEFCDKLKKVREQVSSDVPENLNEHSDGLSKECCNLLLCLCYLYNFGVIHCTLLYDIVRDCLDSFREVDIEMLLLILRHCGRALRTDDPSALKEIVLLVQKRTLETKGNGTVNASRVDYMVSAITDLKNNKRKNDHDASLQERTAKLRKILGQIKSQVASSCGGFRSGTIMQRVSLADILNAEFKGRYWKVGASWAGNQFNYQNGHHPREGPDDPKENQSKDAKATATEGVHDEEEEKISKLAEQYRMNSDTRRTIFRIIMGSSDFEDAFEKLDRAELLKNRVERETVRVLLECCGNEKHFNKYYSLLASRICEYQPQCKFSFQLAFWDSFKTLDHNLRRAANLAKLLFQLVVVHGVLRLSILKAIDMSSPEDMSEATALLLTMFLSSMLDYFENPSEASRFFEHGVGTKKKSAKLPEVLDNNDDDHLIDESEALRSNLTVFLVQILKLSPSYKKGSKFRANLKAVVKALDSDRFFESGADL